MAVKTEIEKITLGKPLETGGAVSFYSPEHLQGGLHPQRTFGKCCIIFLLVPAYHSGVWLTTKSRSLCRLLFCAMFCRSSSNSVSVGGDAKIWLPGDSFLVQMHKICMFCLMLIGCRPPKIYLATSIDCDCVVRLYMTLCFFVCIWLHIGGYRLWVARLDERLLLC